MPEGTSRAQLTFESPIGLLRVSAAAIPDESRGKAQLVEVKLRAPQMPDSQLRLF